MSDAICIACAHEGEHTADEPCCFACDCATCEARSIADLCLCPGPAELFG